MRKLTSIASVLMLAASLAQSASPGANVPQGSEEKTRPSKRPSEEKGGNNQTKAQRRLLVRDPFRNPLAKREVKILEPPAREQRPPGIAGMLISEVKLIGLAKGIEQERIAVLGGPDQKAYFLREGDRLFDGYIKEISDGAVTFIREIYASSGEVRRQAVIVQLYQTSP